jgi:hypothetical protein
VELIAGAAQQIAAGLVCAGPEFEDRVPSARIVFDRSILVDRFAGGTGDGSGAFHINTIAYPLSYCQVKSAEQVDLKKQRGLSYLRMASKKIPADVKDIFRAFGKQGGKKRSKNLTPEERSEIARKAGKAGGRGRKKEVK